ncbi:DUF1761 domain-containing protein [Candidatus Parcubacteria bacterium]|nr:DUF1761 domain-containing protein [Candidatus Parcubacteria bacterium]
MYFVTINWWAVLLAAVAHFILGFLWYGPVFGKTWMRLSNIDPAMTDQMKAGAKKAYVISFIGALVMAYVISLIVNNLLVLTLDNAVKLGAMLWLGFIATSNLSNFLFSKDKKPWSLYFLTGGYDLLGTVLMTVIIYWLQ